jgi:hypothetical protein
MVNGRRTFLLWAAALAGIFLIASCGEQSMVVTDEPITTTKVELFPTPLSTWTPSPTPPPPLPPSTRCQEIIDAQFPWEFLTEGSIIFSGECDGIEGLYRLSAETRKITPFLRHLLGDDFNWLSMGGYDTSLDNQWFAITRQYRDVNDSVLFARLFISGEDESTAFSYPLSRNNKFIDQWMKYGLLSLYTGSANDVGISRIFLTPQTGRIFRFNFFPGDLNYIYSHFYAIDPPAARVVYLSDNYLYVLREIETNRIIWQSDPPPNGYSYVGYPAWSPDGMYFTIASSSLDGSTFNMVVVSRDGLIVKKFETFSTARVSQHGAVNVTWSKDGKYLSFWNKANSIRLAFWERATDRLIYPNIDFADESGSPHFITSDKFTLFDYNGRVLYLVDLASDQVSHMDINLHPYGWINTRQDPVKPDETELILPASGSSVIQSCLNPIDALDSDVLKAQLIIYNQGDLYTLDTGGIKRSLGNTEYAYISPNTNWLFYITTAENYEPHFWLYSANTEPEEKIIPDIFYEYLSGAIGGWENDNEIWIGTSTGLPLFNPFQDTYRENPIPRFYVDVIGCISLSCPEGSYAPNPYDSNYERLTILSPGYPEGTISMSDREGNILWERYSRYAGFNMPIWQPGDQLFGIPFPKNDSDEYGEHYEIYTVDRDGRQNQLTNYYDAYPAMIIDKFSWSADGRYIAFWGDTHSRERIAQQYPYRLFVLDTQTRQTTDYCAPGTYGTSPHGFGPAPIWSPDGSQIAYETYLDGKRMVMLADLESGSVSPVAEGQLIGWLTK